MVRTGDGVIEKEKRCLRIGARVGLFLLSPEDVGDLYLRWMNDPDVLRFTEARHETHTLRSLQEFVEGCLRSSAYSLMGILEVMSGRYVGNLKIGPVHPRYMTASLGIIVGEKDCWRKGYATEAIRLACAYAFEDLDLFKLTAGCIAGNTGALRAFEKAGFQVEGIRRKQNLCHGKRKDEILLGLLKEEWDPNG